MGSKKTARDLLALASEKPPGEHITVALNGRRLAIVDAAWLDDLLDTYKAMRDGSGDALFKHLFGGRGK